MDVLVMNICRNIISYRSRLIRYRYLRRSTRATTRLPGSSRTAARLFAPGIETAPTRVRETATTTAAELRRTTSSWPALSRRSPTPCTAAAVVGTTAPPAWHRVGRLATAWPPRRARFAPAAVVTERAAARWPTAPTRWRARTPAASYSAPATPRRHCDTRLHSLCLRTSSLDIRWASLPLCYVV